MPEDIGAEILLVGARHKHAIWYAQSWPLEKLARL